jgi:hypothetical protein
MTVCVVAASSHTTEHSLTALKACSVTAKIQHIHLNFPHDF